MVDPIKSRLVPATFGSHRNGTQHQQQQPLVGLTKNNVELPLIVAPPLPPPPPTSGNKRPVSSGRERAKRKSINDNLQNIALAHLLVTHILLWLMKLNSISLFQFDSTTFQNEDQHQREHFHTKLANPSSASSSSSPNSNSNNNNNQFHHQPVDSNQKHHFTPTVRSVEFAINRQQDHKERQNNSLDDLNNGNDDKLTPVGGNDENGQDNKRHKAVPAWRQNNRIELESILRRKLPKNRFEPTTPTSSTSLPPPPPPISSNPLTTTTSTTSSPTTTTTSAEKPSIRLRLPVESAIDLKGADGADSGQGARGLRSASRHLTKPGQVEAGNAIDQQHYSQPDEDFSAVGRAKVLHGQHLTPPPPPLTTTTTTSTTRSPEQALRGRQFSAATRQPPPPITYATDDYREPPSTPPPPPTPTPMPPQPPIPKSNQWPGNSLMELKPNISASLFKSSLPKRMTAFRQGRPSQRTSSTSILPALTSTATTTTTSTTTTTTTTPKPPTEASSTTAKMRERELSEPEEATGGGGAGLADGAPEEEDSEEGEQAEEEAPRRRRVQVQVSRHEQGQEEPNRPDISAVIRLGPPEASNNSNRSRSNIRRPFPSVDQDPPTPTRSQQVAASSNYNAPATMVRYLSTEGPPPLLLATSTGGPTGPPQPPAPITIGVTAAAGYPEDGALGPEAGGDETTTTAADTEIDLDSLLPPVPDYNETQSEEESEISLRLPARQPRRLEGQRAAGRLAEDPFVFNEAASSRVLVNLTTVNATGLTTTTTTTIVVNSTQFNATKEALVMQQHQHQQHKQRHHQPSFADFLMPLVQQYHILILTILFNMWLDSMRTNKFLLGANKVNNGSPVAVANQKSLLMLTGGQQQTIPTSTVHSPSTMESPILSSSSPSSTSTSSSSSSSSSSSTSSSLLSPRSDSSTDSNRQLVAFHRAGRGHQQPRQSSLSSEQLIWLEKERRRRLRLISSLQAAADNQSTAATGADSPQAQSSSVCSVFFGLLVISSSLIVILLGVDLLSLLTQCLTQLVSILTCLVGLCIIWRLNKRQVRRDARRTKQLQRLLQAEARKTRHSKADDHNNLLALNHQQQQCQASAKSPAVHRNFFHYLFLLAAYYCGISTALNLGNQHQQQQLFPQQVVHFIQRHLQANQSLYPTLTSPASHLETPGAGEPTDVALLANYQLLFHAALALKGLVLVVQVTLQTILIRSSWRHAKTELRQIYTFLMFANLGLWALEICDQQQLVHSTSGGGAGAGNHTTSHLNEQQQQQVAADGPAAFELLTLAGFTQFSGSVVTLSHLYHGLVFMQH